MARHIPEENLEAHFDQLVEDFGLDKIQALISTRSRKKRGRPSDRDYTDVAIYLLVSTNRRPDENLEDCFDRMSKMGQRRTNNQGAKIVSAGILAKKYDSAATIRTLYYRAKRRLNLRDVFPPEKRSYFRWNPGDEPPEEGSFDGAMFKAVAEMSRAADEIRKNRK